MFSLPWRVRLSSSQPLARSSRLEAPRKLSPFAISPLYVLLGFTHIPIPFSTGITAATFKTSFNALALKVAAPRRAAQGNLLFDLATNQKVHNEANNVANWN